MNEIKNLNGRENKIVLDVVKTLSLFASFQTGGSCLKIAGNLLKYDKLSFKKPSLLDIFNQLIILKKKGVLDEKFGQYYFKFSKLKGNELLERMKISDYKISKIKSYRKFFKFIPFVKGIFLTGSVSIQAAQDHSDIDLLVICRLKTLWLVRIYMTIFFDILTIRRKGKNIRDKLCLNHFIDEDNLEIKDKTIYSAFNYINSIPFYVRDKHIWKKFMRKNLWLKEFFYEVKINSFNNYIFYEKSIITKAIEMLVSLFLWRPFYGLIKNIQIYFIKKNPLTYFKNSRIIYNDKEIIFHPLPRSLEVERTFEAILQKVCNFLKLENE